MIRPRLLLAFILSIASSLTALAQTDRASDYIQKFGQLAIDEMIRSGVPASITLAQGILETGGGQSILASQANNHFGIKCKNEWTGETILHDDDARNECFRKYPSVEESYRDHSEFLRSRPHYAFLFKLDPTDYEGWAKGLKKAGYATDPSYPQRLMKLIVDYNLQNYTLVAINKKENVESSLFVFNNAEPAAEAPVTAVSNRQVHVPENIPAAKTGSRTLPTHRYEGYTPNEVFAINDARVVYTRAGTSLLALANNFNLSYKKLLDFNDLDETDILPTDQLIFLQKKQKRGNRDVHVVLANETLHDICQKEGVQMASLMEYNRLQKGMQPAAGERLYLQYPAPASPRLASRQQPVAENTMR